MKSLLNISFLGLVLLAPIFFVLPAYSQVPTLVDDINPDAGSSAPKYLTEFNSKLYFQADDGTEGNELWVYDGNTASRVDDTNPVEGRGLYPNDLFVFDSKLYFEGNDDISGQELWVYAGVKAFPWPMFLPAVIGQNDPESTWRVLTKVTCPTPLTFTVTLDGTTRSSTFLRPGIDIEGTYSEWASTTPGNKNISWQATCSSYPPGWSGSLDHTMKDGMSYLIILDDVGNNQPVVKVQ